MSIDENALRTAEVEWEHSMTSSDSSKKKKPIPKNVFNFNAQTNHDIAVALFKYVFEKYLDMDPHDIFNFIDNEMIDNLHLRQAYNALIWPEGLDKRIATWYVLIACYPNSFRNYTKDKYWIMEYNQMLSSKISIGTTVFDCDDGKAKSKLFLNSFLRDHIKDEWKDLKTMYLYFASKQGKKMIQEAKLKKALELFYSSPLEYFHECVPDSNVPVDNMRSGMLYMYADFMTKAKLNPFGE